MLSVSTITESINATLEGNGGQSIAEPIALDVKNVRDDVIMWCRPGNEALLNGLKHGTVICAPIDRSLLRAGCNYLFVSNPRQAFQKVMTKFFMPPLATGVSATAFVGKNVTLGENIYLGHHVVIENNCVIGNDCRIDHNTVIRSKTILGNNVIIGCNTSIGSDGFGYEKNEDSIQELIPHIGNVRIDDYVEIGDNVTIDKALLGSTVIGSHSKIDNQVYIAHGVTIGRNCLLIGGSVVSGSTRIADNVWISPNATLMNKINVGEKAMIGIGAVVLRDIDKETIVAGNPARPINLNNIGNEQL